MNPHFKEVVQARRERIDALLQSARQMVKRPEGTLVVRSLESAKHALGNALGKAGSQTSYTVVDNPLNIPPTAEVVEKGAIEVGDDELKNINALREAIQKELDSFMIEFRLDLTASNYLLVLNLGTHYTELEKAKNWLGEQLAILRKEAVKANYPISDSIAFDTQPLEALAEKLVKEESEVEETKKSAIKKKAEK